MRNAVGVISLVAVTLILTSSAIAQTEMVVSAKPGDTVPVYQTNAISSPVIDNLNNGEIVKALESRFGWTLIRTPGDKLGYIAAANLSSKPAVAPQTPAPAQPQAVPAPTASAAPAVSTQKVSAQFPKSAIVKSDGKEADVTVRFDGDRMGIVSDSNDPSATKSFLYTDVKSGEYSYSKAPRYKTAILVAWPLFFTKGKKHWFTVVSGSDSAVLHLDKKNYKAILASFEAHTGLKVEIAAEEK